MRRSLNVLRITFIATALMSGGTIITGLLGIGALSQHMSDGLDTSYETYSSIVDLYDSLSVLTLIPIIAGFIALITWTRRAFKESERIAIQQFERKYSRGMAIGSWFIPIGNVFVPKKVISEIEKIAALGTDPNDTGLNWQSRDLRLSGRWWWILWIISGLIARGASNMDLETDVNGFLTADAYYQATTASMISDVVVIVSIILGIRYLNEVTRDLENIQPSKISGTK